MGQAWQPGQGEVVALRAQPTGRVVATDVHRGRHRVLVRWSETAPPLWYAVDDLSPAPEVHGAGGDVPAKPDAQATVRVMRKRHAATRERCRQ